MNELLNVLHKVQKPGRYIGEEINVCRKRFSEDKLSVVMAYPDMYEVGMSYLGIKILYHLINEHDDMICERVFAPWSDMEMELRNNGMRLFSLESKKALNEFDVVGFSLSHELTYTNVLNMLDLGGITLYSEERKDEEPLVIAGGAGCYNPEPMSKFIDAFILGDAEEFLPIFLKRYRELKRSSKTRRERLKSLSSMEGVYIPLLYKAEYDKKGFSGIKTIDSTVPETVKKIVVRDFDKAFYPVKQLVPLIRIVHDRIAVEIMRGCPNKCRFCQAKSINWPVRIRSREVIRQICKETYGNTGFERIALLSLSSINYPHLAELVKDLNDDFRGKGVGLSIPSLRVDESFYELPQMLSSIRKGGLTFAPETANSEMSKTIGKVIDLSILNKSALIAYKNGWRKLKLYFMVGFPGGTDEEAARILDLASELSRLKKQVSGGAAEIKVSVNPFVPKPHTPFQWMGIEKRENLIRIKKILYSGRSKKIKINFNDIDRSMLESCLSRGDRRMSDIIFSAWKKGAKMDSWDEYFDFSLWKEAFREQGLDVDEVAGTEYSLDRDLPWSHIKTDLKEEFIKKDLAKSGLID